MTDRQAAQDTPGWIEIFRNDFATVHIHPQLEALRIAVGGIVVIASIIAFHEYAIGQLGPIMKQPKSVM